MSRHASRSSFGRAACAAGILALVAPLVDAQTIADYSRAQRALLENAMAQAAARSATPVASAPVAAASAPVVPTVAVGHPSLPPPQPAVQVSGVFAAARGAVAEVVVDGTPYLLRAGEPVPGTAWQVRAVAIDRVVLTRRGAGAVADAQGALHVFPLPALR